MVVPAFLLGKRRGENCLALEVYGKQSYKMDDKIRE